MKFGPRLRRAMCAVSVAGAGISFVTLFFEVGNALPPGTPPAGSIEMTPSSGDSGTTFSLSFTNPPQVCPGDGIAGYRWGTFITPITNDPAAMTFTVSGSPQGPAVTSALRNPAGVQIRTQLPGLTDALIVAPSQVTFASVAFATLPGGDYWIGISCTLSDAGGIVQTVKFWTKAITITSTAGAGPNNFTYAAAAAPTTTTTTTTSTTSTTTTTTLAGTTTSTTTTPARSSTTTVPGGTTTVPGGSTTSTTVFAGVASGAGGTGGSSVGSSGVNTGGTLARTGSSPIRLLISAILLLAFGRMAVLLGRPLRVLPAERS